jgi:hypothetical protein
MVGLPDHTIAIADILWRLCPEMNQPDVLPSGQQGNLHNKKNYSRSNVYADMPRPVL